MASEQLWLEVCLDLPNADTAAGLCAGAAQSRQHTAKSAR